LESLFYEDEDVDVEYEGGTGTGPTLTVTIGLGGDRQAAVQEDFLLRRPEPAEIASDHRATAGAVTQGSPSTKEMTQQEQTEADQAEYL
jgi:hypothetical protein